MNSQRRNLILLYFTLAVILLSFGVLIPLEAFLVDEIGASGKALGALISFHALFQLIFPLDYHVIIAYRSRKWSLHVQSIAEDLS